LVAVATWVSLPAVQALFHIAVIDEVMVAYDGDPDVQFVEIRMKAPLQRFVANTVLGAFDADGNYIDDVLVVPDNVPVDGGSVPWLMATEAFETVSGVTADFIFPPMLPVEGGMICWGAPGFSAPDPTTWDHEDPANYTDCIAYGTYDGPTNSFIGEPTTLVPDGHSLQRLAENHNSATDFTCADPATPANNGGDSDELAATTPCSTAVGCVGDCNGTGTVNVAELVTGVNIALGELPLDRCPSFDAGGDGGVSVAELITAVGNALNGCPS
jgi:hypothetical protein